MSNIVLRTLSFANVMSYAGSNTIHFDADQVTQLIGKNGAGKSTLATILEEVCYNKNSRGIKKADLFCWNNDQKEYSISLSFSKDDDNYVINKVVKSTAKVTLTKNGEDISGHTATQTYKSIEDIFGCDFTTFTKLVYQSIGSSLDFLKSTDANRKAFLVNLFNQEQYKDTSEKIKADAKTTKSELDVVSGKLSTLQQIIARTTNVGEEQQLVEVPEFDDTELQDEISSAKVRAALAKENQAKTTRLASLDKEVQAAQESFEPFENLPAPTDKSEELSQVTRELTIVSSEADKVKARYKKFRDQASNSNCPTCGHELDVSDAARAAQIAKEEYQPLFERRTSLEEQVASLRKDVQQFQTWKKAKDRLDSALCAKATLISEFGEIPEVLDMQDAVKEANDTIRRVTAEIQKRRAEIEQAQSHNSEVTRHNANRKAKLEQLEQAKNELGDIEARFKELQETHSELEVLATAFKDLVAYKLEHCVKTFEELINKYLSELTAGKFALGFELDATKLLVVIYNDGRKTTMESCSTGQQHRIQISTLLAIRALMSAISKVNINLLFLDEVISFIDTQGINTLVELLVKEHDLNSFLVSHGHSHPYAKVIEIIQDEEGISRLSE